MNEQIRQIAFSRQVETLAFCAGQKFLADLAAAGCEIIRDKLSGFYVKHDGAVLFVGGATPEHIKKQAESIGVQFTDFTRLSMWRDRYSVEYSYEYYAPLVERHREELWKYRTIDYI